jgi:hypothetical protein
VKPITTLKDQQRARENGQREKGKGKSKNGKSIQTFAFSLPFAGLPLPWWDVHPARTGQEPVRVNDESENSEGAGWQGSRAKSPEA